MAEAELAKDNRPIAYIEGHRPVYRASACGGCIRALVAARIGFDSIEPPEFVTAAAAHGEALEPMIVERLSRKGMQIHSRQREVEIEAPAWVIRGHIDGIANIEGAGEHVLEVKTMSRRRYGLWRGHGLAAFPRYSAQVAVYHYALQLPILYAVVNRDTGEMDVVRLLQPPVPFESVRAKLNLAEVWARKGKLPDCDYPRGSMERRVCPYAYLCDSAEAKEEAEEASQETGTVIEWDTLAIREWARRYLEAREAEVAAAALKDEARERLASLLGGEGKAEVPGYRVSLQKRARKGFDTAALEKAFGSALDPYRTVTEYLALTVTPTKGR